MVTCLLTDRRLRSWVSGAVLTTWSLTRSKEWRWSRTSGEKPPCSPPTHHHEQNCDCSGVIQVPGHHNFSGPEVGQSYWVHCKKRPSRGGPASFSSWGSSTCQELLKQFYSAIIESVLCTSITVWFSSATKSELRRLRRVVLTAERIIGTTLPTLQELYSSRVSKRAVKITLDPHTSTLPLWTVTVWPTLQSFEHQNDQTQTQFFSPSNPSHEYLTIIIVHTLFIHLHTYLYNTHT